MIKQLKQQATTFKDHLQKFVTDTKEKAKDQKKEIKQMAKKRKADSGEAAVAQEEGKAEEKPPAEAPAAEGKKGDEAVNTPVDAKGDDILKQRREAAAKGAAEGGPDSA